jgi:hypothetical protein
MERRGSIIVAAVTAGILVAGTAATFSIVNASQAEPEPDTIALVVDPAAAVAGTTASGPTFQPEPLPEIVFTTSSASPDPGQPADDLASPQADPEQSATSGSISASRARSLVLAEAPGSVVSVGKTTRDGFPAFAVKVKRADGSTVTGYVTRADGVIFDWTQTAAPAPAYADDEEEGEYEGDEEGEEEDDEESEHEGSDHDGDDD